MLHCHRPDQAQGSLNNWFKKAEMRGDGAGEGQGDGIGHA